MFNRVNKRILNTLSFAEHDESGRSLTEMMGTLAIMGMLALAGIWMYNTAMNNLRAGTLINEAQKRAVVVAGQIGFQGRTDPSLGEFSDNTFAGGTFSTNVFVEGLYQQFGIQVSGVSKRICQNILNTIGDGTVIRRLSHLSNPTEAMTACSEDDTFLLIYNNDMSSGGNDASYCDSSVCQTACGQCITEGGNTHCINECPSDSGQCTSDADCQGDCVGCVIPSGQTKGTCQSCTRVAYLQASGTQRIDTGITPNQDTSMDLKFNLTNTSTAQFFAGARTSPTQNSFAILIWTGYKIFSEYANSGNIASDFTYHHGDDCHVTLDKNKLYVNDKLYTTHAYRTFTAPGPISLFAVRTGSTFDNQVFRGKMYYCKIWNNGTLARDFVPVLDPHGVPAMYDKVSKTLFYNTGSGTFATGSL